jgi:hypothetical protein
LVKQIRDSKKSPLYQKEGIRFVENYPSSQTLEDFFVENSLLCYTEEDLMKTFLVVRRRR